MSDIGNLWHANRQYLDLESVYALASKLSESAATIRLESVVIASEFPESQFIAIWKMVADELDAAKLRIESRLAEKWRRNELDAFFAGRFEGSATA